MSDKYTLMQAEKAHVSIARMARLLKVSTSGYYSWVRAQDRNWDHLPPRVRSKRVLDRAVRRIWVDSHKTYGYLRVHAQLRREGTRVNRKTVARYRAWATGQGLLEGSLPPLGELHKLLKETMNTTLPPQNASSVEPYRELVVRLR